MTDTLTNIERIALTGLVARREAALAPIIADERMLLAEIEARVGLDDGAIGRTHQLREDGDGIRVVPVEAKEETA